MSTSTAQVEETKQKEVQEEVKQVDVTVWHDWQKEWFWKVYRKNAAVMAMYVALVAGYITNLSVDADIVSLMQREAPEEQKRRLWLTLVGAAFSFFVFYINTFHGVAPLKSEVKYILLSNNVGGHYIYLTVNIIWGHVLYWSVCVLAEYLRLHGHLEYILAQKIVLASHMFCVFSNTMGIVLTLLFLKFNYFERGWIETVYNVYKARGYKYWGTKVLFLHCTQLFLAFIDVLCIRDRALLYTATPTLLTLAQISLAYTFTYIIWVHLNKYVSDGYVPYPILEKVMKSWRLEAIFMLTVSTLVLVCSIGLHILATVKLPFIDGVTPRQA